MPFGFGALKNFANSAVSAATNVATEAAKAAETAATAAAAVAEGAAQQATAAASQVTGTSEAAAPAAPPPAAAAPVKKPPVQPVAQPAAPPAVAAPVQPAAAPVQPAAAAQPAVPAQLDPGAGGIPGPRGPGGLRPRGPPRGALTPRGAGPPGGFPPGPPGGPRLRGPRPPGPRGQTPGGTPPRGPRPPWPQQGQPPGQGPPGTAEPSLHPNNAQTQPNQQAVNQQQQPQQQQQLPNEGSVSNVVQGQNQMGPDQVIQPDPLVQPHPMDNSGQTSLQQNPGQSDINLVGTSGAINHINDPGLLQPNDQQMPPHQDMNQDPSMYPTQPPFNPPQQQQDSQQPFNQNLPPQDPNAFPGNTPQVPINAYEPEPPPIQQQPPPSTFPQPNQVPQTQPLQPFPNQPIPPSGQGGPQSFPPQQQNTNNFPQPQQQTNNFPPQQQQPQHNNNFPPQNQNQQTNNFPPQNQQQQQPTNNFPPQNQQQANNFPPQNLQQNNNFPPSHPNNLPFPQNQMEAKQVSGFGGMERMDSQQQQLQQGSSPYIVNDNSEYPRRRSSLGTSPPHKSAAAAATSPAAVVVANSTRKNTTNQDSIYYSPQKMDRMADEYSRMKQALLSDLLDDEEEDEIEEDLEATEEDRPQIETAPKAVEESLIEEEEIINNEVVQEPLLDAEEGPVLIDPEEEEEEEQFSVSDGLDEEQFRSNFEDILIFHEAKTREAERKQSLGAVTIDVSYPVSPEEDDEMEGCQEEEEFIIEQGIGSLAGEVYTIPEEPEAEEGSPTGGDGVSRKRRGGVPPMVRNLESTLPKPSIKVIKKIPPPISTTGKKVSKPLPKTASPKKTAAPMTSMSEVDRRVLMKSPVTVRKVVTLREEDADNDDDEIDVPLMGIEDLEEESLVSETRAPVDGDRLFSSSIGALELGGYSSVSTSNSELRGPAPLLSPSRFKSSPFQSQTWIKEKEADLDRREVNLDLERGRRELDRDRRELEKDRKMLEEFERKRRERELEMEREKLELEKEHFRHEQMTSEKRERERREMIEREKIEILESERREMETRLEEETLRREAALIKREREIMLREQSERERALELERLELEHQQQVLFETEQRRVLEDKEVQIEVERREKEEALQKQKLLQQKKLLQQQKKQQHYLQEQKLLAQKKHEQMMMIKQQEQLIKHEQLMKQEQQKHQQQQQKQMSNKKTLKQPQEKKSKNPQQAGKQAQIKVSKERGIPVTKASHATEKSKKLNNQSSKVMGMNDGCGGGGGYENFGGNSMDSEGMMLGMEMEPSEDWNIYSTNSAKDDFYSAHPSNHRGYVDTPSKINGTPSHHSSNRPSSPSMRYSTGKRPDSNILDRQQQQRSKAEEILQREREFIERERSKLAREREQAFEKEREYERALMKMKDKERASSSSRLESSPSRSSTGVSFRNKDSRNSSTHHSQESSGRNNYSNNISGNHGDDESISGMLNNFSKALGDIRDIREKRMKRLEDSSPPRSSKNSSSIVELDLLKSRSSSQGQSSHSIKFSSNSSARGHHNSRDSSSSSHTMQQAGGQMYNRYQGNNVVQQQQQQQQGAPNGMLSNYSNVIPGVQPNIQSFPTGGYVQQQQPMGTQMVPQQVQQQQQQQHQQQQANMMRGQQQQQGQMMNQQRYVPQQAAGAHHPGMQTSQSMHSLPTATTAQTAGLLGGSGLIGELSPLLVSQHSQQPTLLVSSGQTAQQPLVTSAALTGRLHNSGPDPLQQQALAAAILGQDIANQQNQQQLYLQQMQNLKKMRQRLPHSKTSGTSPLLLRKEMSRIPSAALLSGATLAMSEHAKPSRSHRNQGNLDTVLLQAARAQHGITGNWTPVGTPDTLSETGSLKSRSRRTLPYLPPEEPMPLPSQAKKSQDRMRAYANMRQSSFDGATRALLSSVKPRSSSSETNLRKLTSSEHYSRPGSALGLLQGIKKASSVVSSYGPTSATKEHEKRILENILPPDLRHLVRGGSPSAVQHMKQQIEEEIRKTSGDKFSGTEAEQARKNAERRLFGPLGSAQSERIRQEMQRYATMRDPRLRAEMKHKLNPGMDAQFNRNRRYRGHRRQLSDPRMTSTLTDNLEDEYLIGRPYSSLAREFDPLAESLGMDNSQSYFGSGALEGGGSTTTANILKDHSGLDGLDDRNRYLTNRRSQLIRRSSEGGLTSSYLEGGGAMTSLGHTAGGGIPSPLNRRAHSSLSGRMHSRSWHPSPFGSDDDVVSSDEPHFYKEEKQKNRIKMEIARRRQQIEENACLHEELTRLAKLRETAEITDRLSGMGLGNTGAQSSHHHHHHHNSHHHSGVVSSNSPLVADSTSVLKSVDEVLRDPDSGGTFRSSSAPLGRRYGGGEPFNSDLYTSSVYDRVTDFSPIHSGDTMESTAAGHQSHHHHTSRYATSSAANNNPHYSNHHSSYVVGGTSGSGGGVLSNSCEIPPQGQSSTPWSASSGPQARKNPSFKGVANSRQHQPYPDDYGGIGGPSRVPRLGRFDLSDDYKSRKSQVRTHPFYKTTNPGGTDMHLGSNLL